MTGDAVTPVHTEQGRGLTRVLGARDGAMLVFANVVGAGIFLTPGMVAAMVPGVAGQLALWLLGGLIAFAGALAYAELATLRPRAGGEYVYIREAFGPLAGFLCGWTSFVAGFSGAIAASAVGFGAYLGRFVPLAGDTRSLASLATPVGTLTLSPNALTAIAVIAIISAVHMAGVRSGATVQNGLVVVKAGLGLILIAAGFAFGSPSGLPPVAPVMDLEPAAGSWLFALIPILFTYSGWNAAAYVAEEMKAPERNLPRALLGGTLAVTLFYLALNVLFLQALPAGALAGVVQVGDAVAAALFGAIGAAAVSAFILLALGTGMSAMIVTGPRIYFAMARDGLFPERVARVSPRRGTPDRAFLAQGAWSTLLVLSGSFEQILTYTGFAIVLFSAIAVLSLFRLRRLAPTRGQRFTTWGYPLVPALFVAISLLIAANALREQPGVTLAGLAVIAAGLPVYAWMRRR